jgi:hypothetical protein
MRKERKRKQKVKRKSKALARAQQDTRVPLEEASTLCEEIPPPRHGNEDVRRNHFKYIKQDVLFANPDGYSLRHIEPRLRATALNNLKRKLHVEAQRRRSKASRIAHREKFCKNFHRKWGALYLPEDSSPEYTRWACKTFGVAPPAWNLTRWEKELRNHPDKQFTRYLLRALEEGFSTHHTGKLVDRFVPNPNLPQAAQDTIDKNFRREIKLGRMFTMGMEADKRTMPGTQKGPFADTPLMPSSYFAVPKLPLSRNKWRIITNMAYKGTRKDPDHVRITVNAGTNKYDFPVNYDDVDETGDSLWITKEANRLKGTKETTLYMAKFDLKEAFRQLLMNPADSWNKQVFMWYEGGDNIWTYLVDAYLCFGGTAGPGLQERVSETLVWILQTNYGIKNIRHLLDDFLIWSDIPGPKGKQEVHKQLTMILEVLKGLGVAVNTESGDGWAKTEDATYQTAFLGITYNTKDWTLAIADDKWHTTRTLLQNTLSAAARGERIPAHVLATLIGKLHWICKILPAAKPFLKEGYNALYRIENYGKLKRAKYETAKLHEALVRDLEFWMQLMSSPTVPHRRMFMRPIALPDAQIPLSSDATPVMGAAAFGREWFTVNFHDHPEIMGKSIMYKELYMMVAAVMTWGEKLKDTQFVLWGDNQGACYNVYKNWSRKADMHELIKQLALTSIKHNCRAFVKWISTHDNTVSDQLSRGNRLTHWSCRALHVNPIKDPNLPTIL